MSRYAVLIGSVLALLLALPAVAAQRATYLFDGNRITFTQFVDQPAGRAVSIDDPAFAQLLRAAGATITYQPGQRYILITTAEPVVISFAVGDPHYDVGPVTQSAAFAPFSRDGHTYLPLTELLRGLDLAVKDGSGQQILQPQLAMLDLESDANGTKLVAHAGIPLDAKIVSDQGGRVVIAFDGVGTTLPATRTLAGGAIHRIDVRTDGPALHPVTYATLYLAAGATHSALGTDDQRDMTIGFNGTQPAQPVAAAPAQEPAEQGSPAPAPAVSPSQTAQVTSVQTQAQSGSVIVRIALDAPVTYEWHRLRPPDNRWWIDLHGARLVTPSDQPQSGIVSGVRSHQENPDTVRVALSLSDFDVTTVSADEGGITITVDDRVADDSAPRSGSGMTGANAVAAVQPNPGTPAWKFGPRPQSTYVAANPRLIVIDPGHGGSDDGAIREGVMEKSLNLDMSRRLRDILVARGWQVVMTREDDRDVYAPNDSATQELQARDDVANSNGARLLVSLHSNSFINDGPHGTTVYYYKDGDVELAQDVDRRIASELGIFNNGVVKDKLYVIHHADMPATLVEAAFLSNPDDRALLESPEWRQKLAQAIADGIADYAGPPPPSSSASNQ